MPSNTSPDAARRTALVLVLCAGAITFLWVTGRHYAVSRWLLWRYGAYVSAGVLWTLSVLSIGSVIHRRLEPAQLPTLERWTLALGCGLYCFFLAMFVAGLVGFLNGGFALLLPAAMIAAGASNARACWRRARRFTRAVSPRTLSGRSIGLAIGVGVAMVYFSILSPENPGFDTLWYHLPIAEQYAVQGAIRPFSEGWYYGAYPHLASVVYTWAFLIPGASLFDRVGLAAHLEFFVFLWTLLGTASLTDRLISRGKNGTPRHIGLAAGATFLFPGILLYDGGLFTAADHIFAFFSLLLALSWLRLAESPTIGRALLFGAFVGSLVVTKYQAAWLIPLPALALAPLLWRKRALLLLAPAAGVALASSAPHWLKNWMAYGDPVYPLGAAWFRARPFSPTAAKLVGAVFARGFWPAEGSFVEKMGQVARVLFTFSFEPHDWPTYHGDVPVFGSMFTLLLFTLPFLAVRRRFLWILAFTYAAIGGWYWVSHQDRYLQALVPWMAACTAAAMMKLWTQGPAVRLALGVLLGLQLAWGGGVYFIHARDEHYEIDRPSPLAAAVSLLAAGYEGTLDEKLSPYEPLPSVGRALPQGAKALFHERFLRLGLGAPSVTDLPGSQGALSYDELLSPNAIYDRLAALGVTHVIWQTRTSHGKDTLSGDLAFFRFLAAATSERREVRGYTVAKMVRPSSASTMANVVLVIDCSSGQSGEVTLEEMSQPTQAWDPDALPPLHPVIERALAAARADFLLLRSAALGCYAPAPERFTEAARRKDDALFVRSPPPER
jgi:hypothetical protein